jgi:hypothetical protein
MKQKRILLVEDNASDEALTLRAFSKVNLSNSVVVVRDGQQALDYLFREGEYKDASERALPVAVLLDIALPRVSGLEVLDRIRKNPRTKLLPVVILTSSDEDRDRMRSYESGANSFIRKPVAFAEFAEVVARLGVYWFATNEPPSA